MIYTVQGKRIRAARITLKFSFVGVVAHRNRMATGAVHEVRNHARVSGFLGQSCKIVRCMRFEQPPRVGFGTCITSAELPCERPTNVHNRE
jgi:hypothetical protein